MTHGWKGKSVLYLSPVKALLNNQEPRLSAAGSQVVTGPGGRVVWWTFGGGRANAALATEIGRRLGVSAEADNFAVHFPESVSPTSTHELVEQLRQAGHVGVHAAVDSRAVAGLKFSDCLGADLSQTVIRFRAEDPMAVSNLLAAPVQMVFTQ